MQEEYYNDNEIGGERLKNNYNFGVVKLHLKFNQRTKSTPHKFQTCFPSQNLILFQPGLYLGKGMITNLKRPIVVMVIGYIIGIIWGLYFNFSIVLLYIFITILYCLKICFRSQKYKKFQILSIHRYLRYIKLIFTKQVIFFIIISSIISNTILIFQEKRYKNLYPEENIVVEGIIVSHQEEREYKNRYKVKVLTVNSSDKYQFTQIYIEVKKEIKFQYGDKVRLQGEFRK